MNENKIIIENKLLKEIDCNDIFFDSLRKDYYNFNNWFINKQNNNYKAYITYDKENKLSSFLLLKIEEKEKYLDFDKPLNKLKKLKICTLKVNNINKSIGSSYLKIIDKVAVDNNIKEIYTTVYPKYTKLIKFLEKNNYKYYTNKNTLDGNGKLLKENVYIKKIKE